MRSLGREDALQRLLYDRPSTLQSRRKSHHFQLLLKSPCGVIKTAISRHTLSCLPCWLPRPAMFNVQGVIQQRSLRCAYSGARAASPADHIGALSSCRRAQTSFPTSVSQRLAAAELVALDFFAGGIDVGIGANFVTVLDYGPTGKSTSAENARGPRGGG
jgi:hypothetical protein